jgi:hypothetical protein
MSHASETVRRRETTRHVAAQPPSDAVHCPAGSIGGCFDSSRLQRASLSMTAGEGVTLSEAASLPTPVTLSEAAQRPSRRVSRAHDGRRAFLAEILRLAAVGRSLRMTVRGRGHSERGCLAP